MPSYARWVERLLTCIVFKAGHIKSVDRQFLFCFQGQEIPCWIGQMSALWDKPGPPVVQDVLLHIGEYPNVSARITHLNLTNQSACLSCHPSLSFDWRLTGTVHHSLTSPTCCCGGEYRFCLPKLEPSICICTDEGSPVNCTSFTPFWLFVFVQMKVAL